MSDLSPAQLKYWYRKLAPKIADLADRRVIEKPYTLDPNPWLWTGYTENALDRERLRHRPINHRVPPRPYAWLTAPSWYPAPAGKRIPVQHVVWHLFRGPIPARTSLLYRGLANFTQVDVNPAHYEVGRGGYSYDAPTWAELGVNVIDELDALIAEIESGRPLEELELDFEPHEIAAAQAAILARNAG
jgi:hypothetical protein